MSAREKLFTMRMTEGERARLEHLAHRRGLRTAAALIRRWIAEEEGANRFSAGLLRAEKRGEPINVVPMSQAWRKR